VIAATEAAAVLLVGALCASILALGEVVRRRLGVEAEWTRKLVHVLMGLTAATFPWLFHDPRAVLLLCAACAAVLGVTLARSWLASVHGVDRRTLGALWFPLGVAAVFVAAEGRRELYVIPVLVLALADPAAAMVGRTAGAHRFGGGRHCKSVEGSLAFLVVASGCLFVALAATTSLGFVDLVGRALVTGALLAAVEAASPYGSDNVLVPVGAHLLLRAITPEAAGAVPVAVAFLSAVAALAAAGARPRTCPERAHA
jgi:phytol kinase